MHPLLPYKYTVSWFTRGCSLIIDHSSIHRSCTYIRSNTTSLQPRRWPFVCSPSSPPFVRSPSSSLPVACSSSSSMSVVRLPSSTHSSSFACSSSSSPPVVRLLSSSTRRPLVVYNTSPRPSDIHKLHIPAAHLHHHFTST